MDDLKTILDRIKKPLTFAGRDDFAHLKSLTDLEPFIKGQIALLKGLVQRRETIERVEKLFFGFDSLPPDQKKDHILKAMALIDSLDHYQNGSSPGVISGSQASIVQPSSPDSHAILKLDTPIQYCKGIGPKRAELLKKIGIFTVEDALFYLPWRFEDRGNLKKIGRLTYGTYETVAGTVVSAEVSQTKRRRVKVFELVVTDKSGMLVGSWFNQPFMKKAFKPGQKVILSGIVKSNPYRGGLPQIDNPDYEIMDEDDADNLIHTGRTVPIYRTTAGLSVRYLRSMMKSILDSCGASVPEALPEYLRKKYSFLPAAESLAEVHFPAKERDIAVLNRGMSPAHRRLSFEELFTLELGLSLRKRGVALEKKGISFKDTGALEAALRKNIPFTLTNAQERVISLIMILL